MKIIAIPADKLDLHWEEISPYIERALAFCNDEMSLEDVHSMIEDGVVIPLLVLDKGKILSVVTLEIADKPNKRIMNIMTAGGEELDTWLEDILDTVYILAKEQQADSIYINGRKGWARKLDKFNYTHAYTVLRKEVH